MAIHKGLISVLAIALLGLSTIEGVASATVKTNGRAVASGGKGTVTRAKSSAVAKAVGNSKVVVQSSAKAENGATAVSDVTAVAKDNADVKVVGKADAKDEGAVAIVDAVIKAEGDAKVKAGIFAKAIQLGEGPVIAKAFLKAKAAGDEVLGEAINAFYLATATAIGKAPENAATVAKTIASIIAVDGESRVFLGKALSILIVEKGCGPIQDTIQKAEAQASSSGYQKEFLKVVNVNVKLITCAFPDTCGTDGVDKRSGCCGDAGKNGKCGACNKDGICDFRLIWENPKQIWACETADCKNKKPCICG